MNQNIPADLLKDLDATRARIVELKKRRKDLERTVHTIPETRERLCSALRAKVDDLVLFRYRQFEVRRAGREGPDLPNPNSWGEKAIDAGNGDIAKGIEILLDRRMAVLEAAEPKRPRLSNAEYQ